MPWPTTMFDGLFAEVIDDRKAFESATMLQTVADKIHRPDSIRCDRYAQLSAFDRHTTAPPPSLHL